MAVVDQKQIKGCVFLRPFRVQSFLAADVMSQIPVHQREGKFDQIAVRRKGILQEKYRRLRTRRRKVALQRQPEVPDEMPFLPDKALCHMLPVGLQRDPEGEPDGYQSRSAERGRKWNPCREMTKANGERHCKPS
jgi:hypothetical protein